MIELTPNPLLPQEVMRRVAGQGYGAIVSFVGTVRGTSQGKRVRYLEYEALPDTAEGKLKQIIEEIKARWSPVEVAISHRLGRVGLGEAAVVIAVAAPHRQEAFAACRYAIDRLKEVAPIWKKEVFQDGESWL